MQRLLTSLVLLMGMLTACAANSADAGYTISDTSFQDPVSGRVQQLTVDVAAPADRVWTALTTDAGLRGWVAPVVHIDLMNGGMLEASYSAASRIGERENIRNQIIAYVPGRMIAYQNVHLPKGAPADFALLAAVRTVLEVTPIDTGHSRIVESGVGDGEGPGFDALYAHFASGNRYEFESLARSVLGHPIDWAAEAEKARSSVGDTSK